METKQQKLTEEYGGKFADILNEARHTSLGNCDTEEVKTFAKKIFKLGEGFGSKLMEVRNSSQP